MSIGKGVIEDSAKIQRLGAVTRFLYSPASVGKNTDIDPVPVHDVEILLVIERVEAHSSNVVLSIGYKLKKFTGECMKMSIDDHSLSFLCSSANAN
jgi:hypothetical protein